MKKDQGGAEPARATQRLARVEGGTAEDLMTIIRMLPDVVFRCVKHDDGKIYWTLNEGKLAEEFHLTTQEIRGKSLEELFPGGASDQIKDHFEAAFRGQGKEFVNEMGGRYFKHFPQPVRDKGGEVVAVVGFISEVTSLVKAEERIRSLNDELAARLEALAEANKELEAFGYTVSHDLRGPVTVLDARLQVFAAKHADRLDEEELEELRRMRSTTAKMNALITDILDFSRAARSEVNPKPVDISAMGQEILTELSEASPGRKVSWTVEDGLVVEGDARMVRVVMENLLQNAWKFTGKKPRARIEVLAGYVDGRPGVSVRDNGAGFDPDKSDGLFETFHRLHGQDEFEGTGVGLGTVRRIVDRHGGAIQAEGALDQGATFTFTLAEASE
jgi:signal transduction histidine kinase